MKMKNNYPCGNSFLRKLVSEQWKKLHIQQSRSEQLCIMIHILKGLAYIFSNIFYVKKKKKKTVVMKWLNHAGEADFNGHRFKPANFLPEFLSTSANHIC